MKKKKVKPEYITAITWFRKKAAKVYSSQEGHFSLIAAKYYKQKVSEKPKRLRDIGFSGGMTIVYNLNNPVEVQCLVDAYYYVRNHQSYR
jgi:hypothetical protein